MYIRTGCLFLDTSSFMSNYYKVFMCVVVFDTYTCPYVV